jgi:Peptidase MA superfamily
MKSRGIIMSIFLLVIVSSSARGLDGVSQWSALKPLPAGMYHANSVEKYESINARILRARELSDSLLGDAGIRSYDLYITDTKAQFDSLVRGAFPHWGAAVAVPQLGRIVLKSSQLKRSRKTLATLAAHEFAHLQTHARSGGGAPRWLDEGLAMYFAGEWNYESFISVSLAAVRGNLIPLAEIESLNSFSESRAQVAYAESYLAVRYFFEYYGAEGMRDVLAGLKQGMSIDSVMQSAFGLSEAGFELEAFADIRDNQTLMGIVMGSSLFWGALALVVVIGFVRVMINRKKRYAQWEKEERYQSTDFDYGDPDNPEKVDDEEPWKQDE